MVAFVLHSLQCTSYPCPVHVRSNFAILLLLTRNGHRIFLQAFAIIPAVTLRFLRATIASHVHEWLW